MKKLVLILMLLVVLSSCAAQDVVSVLGVIAEGFNDGYSPDSSSLTNCQAKRWSVMHGNTYLLCRQDMSCNVHCY